MRTPNQVADALIEAVYDCRRLHIVCAGVVYEGAVTAVLHGSVTVVGRIYGLTAPVRQLTLPLADITDVDEPGQITESVAVRVLRARNLRVDP